MLNSAVLVNALPEVISGLMLVPVVLIGLGSMFLNSKKNMKIREELSKKR